VNASRRSGGIFDLPKREARIQELDAITSEPDFWSNPEKAQTVTRERAQLIAPLTGWRKQAEGLEEAQLYLEMAADGDAEYALFDLRPDAPPLAR